MKNYINKLFVESSKIIFNCQKLSEPMENAAQMIVRCFQGGNKVLLIGNGGSAADAQHVAAEFINKFNIDRQPLPAISLHTDTSGLTSISNDYGFDYIFSKQIHALGNKNDVLIVITTSDISTKKNGHSMNLYQAIITAKKKNIKIIGILSDKSKKIGKLVDIAIKVPAQSTPRTQEAHLVVLHIICELVENALFKKRK